MRILFIGHSHMNTLAHAAQARAAERGDCSVLALQLRAGRFRLQEGTPGEKDSGRHGPKRLAGVDPHAIREFLAQEAGFDAAVLCFNGNEHNIQGLFRARAKPDARRKASVERSVATTLGEWLGFFRPLLDVPTLLVPCPPPIESDALLRRLSSRLGEDTQIESPAVRLAHWARLHEIIETVAAQHGVPLLALPPAVFDARGFLAAECIGNNPTHGNERYGARVVDSIIGCLLPRSGKTAAAPPVGAKGSTPARGTGARSSSADPAPVALHPQDDISGTTGRPVLRVLFIGHSHLDTLARAASAGIGLHFACEPVVLQLRLPEFWLNAPGQGGAGNRVVPKTLAGMEQDAIRSFLRSMGRVDAVVFCLNGNEHNVFGLYRGAARDHHLRRANLRRAVGKTLGGWLDFFLPLLQAPAMLVPPPPPLRTEALEPKLAGRAGEAVHIEPAAHRHALWAAQVSAIEGEGEKRGVTVLTLPQAVFDDEHFLAQECVGNDTTHGSNRYGTLVVNAILARLGAGPCEARDGAETAATEPGTSPAAALEHPYRQLPDQAFWRQAVAEPPGQCIDPAPPAKFPITRQHKVATAGSCFAQHISRWLQANGFRYLVTEAAAGAQQDPDYAFSAMYGNIYTARQLLQLFERAFGYFTPRQRVWQRADGRYCDAFRPRLLADGYATRDAVREAEKAHLECVRNMFCELDVLVFTLGLTECWASGLDGAIYPLAPGIAGGHFDPRDYAFLNFSVGDVVRDLQTFLARLRHVNPGARMVLTVSPVPLVATASGGHVLVANARSKAVLRAAADEIASCNEQVCYFPSYEIIAGAPGKLRYFEEDCRSVSAAGVAHVMSVFLRHMVSTAGAAAGDGEDGADIEALLDAECDEELLARPVA